MGFTKQHAAPLHLLRASSCARSLAALRASSTRRRVPSRLASSSSIMWRRRSCDAGEVCTTVYRMGWLACMAPNA